MMFLGSKYRKKNVYKFEITITGSGSNSSHAMLDFTKFHIPIVCALQSLEKRVNTDSNNVG